MSGKEASNRMLAAMLATASPVEMERNWNQKPKSNIKICNANDYQLAARSMLSKPLYEYLASGTDDEQTLSENEVDKMHWVLICNSFILFNSFISFISISFNSFISFCQHRSDFPPQSLHSKIGTFVPE